MAFILGLDPSLRKSGYCVVDTEAPYSSFIERGRLYTTVSDGFVTLRLLKQQRQIKELMERFSIDFVSMEQPYFGDGEAEVLFALNQFIHQIFYSRGTHVIAFPPQQLKSLSIPTKDPKDVGKNHMVMAAQERYHLLGTPITDDEADAMHAAYLGRIYYQWRVDKTLKSSDLEGIGRVLHPEAGELRAALITKKYAALIGPKIYKAFYGKHTYVRGSKKGTTEYKGLAFRENELFWDYTKILERQRKYNSPESTHQGEDQDAKSDPC